MKKRALGGNDGAPFLTAVIALGQSANVGRLLELVRRCDENAKVESTGRNVLHIQCGPFFI